MIDEVKRIVAESPLSQYKKGVAARFQKINDRWGLKFYLTEHTRDMTYNFQHKAFLIGRAPALGEKFDLTLPEVDGYGDFVEVFGYITECVDRLGYNDDEDSFDEDEYCELIEDLETIMSPYDMHSNNVGYLNGRLVAIDFSECDPL